MARPLLTALSLLLVVLVVGFTVTTQHGRPPKHRPAAAAHRGGSSPSPSTSAGPSTSASPSTSPTPQAPVTVVGLGDSVTAGSACPGCADFVQLYARWLPAADGGPGRAVNLGVGGSTSTDLRRDLEQPSRTTRAVSGAAIDLVTIGANDLSPLRERRRESGCDSECWQGSVAQVGANVRAIVADIHRLRHGRPTTILVTNYWNVFVDGRVARDDLGPAYLSWSDRLTRAANRAICGAARSAGARCVDLYAPFKGDGSKDPTSLLAPDGDHPDAAGHRVIARALLAATSR